MVRFVQSRPVIMPVFGRVVRPIQRFLALEAASGILLLVAAVAALAWANLHADSYRGVFDHPLAVRSGDAQATFTVRTLVNDGLMAVFFFVVGMEIKRELAIGELRTPARAALPAIAAVGGMVLPAAIFAAFNAGGPGSGGWGIPMATDIAFCVGILTLLKGRVPHALVVFLVALAIFDDIGGILVIALFYGHGLDATWLGIAAGVGVIAVIAGRRGVGRGAVYALLGAGLWTALHHGGIHATIAGVMLGLAIPSGARRAARDVLTELRDHIAELLGRTPDAELEAAAVAAIDARLEELGSPLDRFLHALHPLVAFGIMPVFALANAGVDLRAAGVAALLEPVALGTGVGLVAGKLVGILAATLIAVRLRLSPMPGQASLRQLVGVATLGGIGFTVALFIASLAFRDADVLLVQAKLGILVASIVAGVGGFLLLRGGRTDPS